jgi:hypothetical protein
MPVDDLVIDAHPDRLGIAVAQDRAGPGAVGGKHLAGDLVE